MKKILFVDDEKNILDGLRRSLRDMRQEWEVYFASSGNDALRVMKDHPIDAIVSDMRMPEMDGSQLLAEVMKESPFTARFILSGQSDQESILKTVGPAHQYFSKPCDLQQIKSTITHALELRNILRNEEMTSTIAQIESLPSIPQIYVDIVNELRREEPDIGKITRLIESDLGFATKVLQIVNSSFFGIANHISDIRQAVSYLGLDIMKSLVLYVKVFHEFSGSAISSTGLSTLMNHSLYVARYARFLVESIGGGRSETEHLFTAACFHDVGKLIFYAYLPKKYQQVLEYIDKNRCSESEAEQQVLGATHAEVGAYLLCLWGLKDAIVEEILFHHHPEKCLRRDSVMLPLLYLSDRFSDELHPETKLTNAPPEPLATEYLEEVGLTARVDGWREMLRNREEKTHG